MSGGTARSSLIRGPGPPAPLKFRSTQDYRLWSDKTPFYASDALHRDQRLVAHEGYRRPGWLLTLQFDRVGFRRVGWLDWMTYGH